MKTIIAGSRTIDDYDAICQIIIDSCFVITEVVSGTARGVDRLGEQWARENNILIKRFPANWSKYGKAAGPIRNEEMVKYAEAAIIVRSDHSKGATSMANLAKQYGLKVRLVDIYG